MKRRRRLPDRIRKGVNILTQGDLKTKSCDRFLHFKPLQDLKVKVEEEEKIILLERNRMWADF